MLVTLPLGVLQANAVTFDPPLPAARVEATARLGVGTLAKLAYEFDEVFWPANQYAFGMAEDPATHPTMIVNLWSSHRSRCLVLLAGGALGRALERMPEADAHAWGMTMLRECFGKAVPEPRTRHRTSWSLDPYARGAYTFIAAGATPADIRTLQEPLGDRIFFAGEATSAEHWGTVHGAYLSGLREAARISGVRSVLPAKTITESRRWRLRMRRAERFFNLRARDLDCNQWSERMELLRKSEVFGVLASEDLSLLAPLMESRTLADGDLLFEQGEQARDAYLVASGQLLRLRFPRRYHDRASRGREGDRRIRDVCRAPSHLFGSRRRSSAIMGDFVSGLVSFPPRLSRVDVLAHAPDRHPAARFNWAIDYAGSDFQERGSEPASFAPECSDTFHSPTTKSSIPHRMPSLTGAKRLSSALDGRD